MMENVDGFVFRRSSQGVNEMCKKRREFDNMSRNVDCAFDFKFVRNNRRKAQDTAEDVEGKIENEVLLNEMDDLESLSGTVIIKEACKKKTDTQEIHDKLDEKGTLDDLLRLCISHISKTKKSAYSARLEEVFRQKMETVMKREIERDIEETEKRIVWAEDEVEKWNRLKLEVLNSNDVNVREIIKIRMDRGFGISERIEVIRREFSQRAEKLEFLKEAARSSIVHVKEQGEELLKRILNIICKQKEVDTLFLLKALSNTGK